MRTLSVPAAIRGKPEGTMMLQVAENMPQCFIREDASRTMRLPRECPVDIRLAVWDYEHVLVVALLVRIDRNDLFTYASWINGAEQSGVQMLQALATSSQTEILFVADQVERAIRSPNLAGFKARSIVRRLERWEAWSCEQFEAALHNLDTLYPTAHAIWWDSRNR